MAELLIAVIGFCFVLGCLGWVEQRGPHLLEKFFHWRDRRRYTPVEIRKYFAEQKTTKR